MRKYVKPEILIEKFELSKHIADCAWELTNSTKSTCAATPDPDLLGWITDTLFENEQICFYGPHNGYEDYCYEANEQGVSVFAS